MNSGASAGRKESRKDALSCFVGCRELARREMTELFADVPGEGKEHPFGDVIDWFDGREVGLKDQSDLLLRTFMYFWMTEQLRGRTGYFSVVSTVAGVKLISCLVQMFLTLKTDDDRRELFNFVCGGDLDCKVESRWIKACVGAMSEARVWYALEQMGLKRSARKNSSSKLDVMGSDLVWVANDVEIMVQVATGACYGPHLLDVTSSDFKITGDFKAHRDKICAFRRNVFANKKRQSASIKKGKSLDGRHAKRLRRTVAVFALIGAHEIDQGKIVMRGLQRKLRAVHAKYAEA